MLHCGSCKTSDFFGQKYGCFASKVRMFASKKSDVFDFRKGESIEFPKSCNYSLVIPLSVSSS